MGRAADGSISVRGFEDLVNRTVGGSPRKYTKGHEHKKLFRAFRVLSWLPQRMKRQRSRGAGGYTNSQLHSALESEHSVRM